MVETNVVIEALERHNIHGSHEDVIGVSEMVKVLTFIFDKLERKEKDAIDIPLSIDLSLNWLLNVYDRFVLLEKLQRENDTVVQLFWLFQPNEHGLINFSQSLASVFLTV